MLRLSRLHAVLFSLALPGILAVALAGQAKANWVLLDVDFENLANGLHLPRTGADFGNPYGGPFDSTQDIIDEVDGTKRVVMFDGFSDPNRPVCMYWGFTQNRLLNSGVLKLAFRVEFDSFDNYEIRLNGAGADNFFTLIFDELGELFIADTDTPLSFIGNYTSKTNDLYELEYDLNAASYVLRINGSVVAIQDAPTAPAAWVNRLSFHHIQDSNTTGVILIDDLLFTYEPGVSGILLDADFDDQPEGTIGTGGPTLGQPVAFDTSLSPKVVEDGDNKVLEICDDGATFGYTRFEFLNGEKVTSGDVCIAFDMTFRAPLVQFMSARVRDSATGNANFLSMILKLNGEISFTDANGTLPETATYQVGSTHRVVFGFVQGSPDRFSYVWIDDELVVQRRDHGVSNVTTGIGSVHFGAATNPATVDCMIIDNVIAYRNVAGATAAEFTPRVAAASLHPAAPNPFNPRTTLSFDLAVPGDVHLVIFDAAGRRVRSLAKGMYPAGLSQLSWDGRNDRGETMASGVYHAQLEAPGGLSSQKLVLVK